MRKTRVATPETDMNRQHLAIVSLLLGLSVSSLDAHAEKVTRLDGAWSGTTQCPMGPSTYTVTILGRNGTAQYAPATGTPQRFPVAIRTSEGWQGEWVYFEMPGLSAKNHQAFGAISGLLAPDGRSMTVEGRGIASCTPFQLTRVPEATMAAPARRGRQPPTEDELRVAIKTEFARIPGVSVNTFRLVNCEAADKGYFCRFMVSINYTWHLGNFNLPPEEATGTFAQDTVSGRWLRVRE